jgi:arabinose-5-phosphate isomerase
MVTFAASDIMTKQPKSIESSELAVAALQLMEEFKITQLIVTENGRYAGLVHMHDLLREGLL